MKRQDQIKIERQSILRAMAKIENIKGKMFHEFLPEIDDEFHGQAYDDLMRLKAIRVNLHNLIDELTMD